MFGMPGLPGLDFSQLDLAQVMRLLQSEGPVNWEIAEQVAGYVALDGATSETAGDRRGARRSSRSWRARPRATSSPRPGSDEHARAEVRSAIGRKEWVDLHLKTLRPVLEALAVTLRKALDATDGRRRPDRASGCTRDAPVRRVPVRHGRWRGRRSVRRPAHDARPPAARRAVGLDGRLPRAARARAATTCRCRPTTSRALRSSCRTSRRSRRRGRSTAQDLRFAVALHEVVHAAERSVPWVRERLLQLAIEYVSAYEVDPNAVESQFGAARPERPVVVRRASRSTRRRCSARCSPNARRRSSPGCRA